jgi:hypothetical protein
MLVAWLLLIVLFVMFAVPRTWETPPTFSAELPETVLSVRLSVPWLEMPAA